jgi:hypothetical protein
MAISKKQRKLAESHELKLDKQYPTRVLPVDIIVVILDYFYTFNLPHYLVKLHNGILLSLTDRTTTTKRKVTPITTAEHEYLMNMYGYFKHDTRRQIFLLFKNMNVREGGVLPDGFCSKILTRRYLCLRGVKRIELDGNTDLSPMLMQQTCRTLQVLTGVREVFLNLEIITNVKCPNMHTLQFSQDPYNREGLDNNFYWNVPFLPSSLRVLHLPLYSADQRIIDYLSESKLEEIHHLSDLSMLEKISPPIKRSTISFSPITRLEHLEKLELLANVSAVELNIVFTALPNLQYLKCIMYKLTNVPHTYSGRGKLESLIIKIQMLTQGPDLMTVIEKTNFITDVIKNNPNLTHLEFPFHIDSEVLENLHDKCKLKQLHSLYIPSAESLDWDKFSQVFSNLKEVTAKEMSPSVLSLMLQSLSLKSLTIDHSDRLYGVEQYLPSLEQFGQELYRLNLNVSKLSGDKDDAIRELLLLLPNLRSFKKQMRDYMLRNQDLSETNLEELWWYMADCNVNSMLNCLPPTLQIFHVQAWISSPFYFYKELVTQLPDTIEFHFHHRY